MKISKNKLIGIIAGVTFFSVATPLVYSMINNNIFGESQNQIASSNIDTRSNQSTNNYNPVMGSNFQAPSFTNEGYIGLGNGEPIIGEDGDVILGTNGLPISSNRRSITFQTYDQNLRWKFDLNSLLLSWSPSAILHPSLLKVVDVKYVEDAQTFFIYSTFIGPANEDYSNTCIFTLDKDGKYFGTPKIFNVPSFGSTRDLKGYMPGETATNPISPYVLKTFDNSSLNNNQSFFIQLVANPLMVSKNDRADINSYFTAESLLNDLNNPNDPIDNKTGAIITFKYDISKKDFLYPKGSTLPMNFTPLNYFENFSATYSGTILSDFIFFAKNDVIGFYNIWISNEKNVSGNFKQINICLFTVQDGNFSISNKVMGSAINPDSIWFDTIAPLPIYNGVAYSVIPELSKFSNSNPGGITVIPSGPNSAIVVNLFGNSNSTPFLWRNWITTDKTNPNFINPINGSIFSVTKKDSWSPSSPPAYLALTINIMKNNLPSSFEITQKPLSNNFNPSIISAFGNMAPLSPSEEIYNKKSSFYNKYAFIDFHANGKFKIHYFDLNIENNYSVFPSASKDYSISSFKDVQSQSKVKGWTPKGKKLTEISDSMLSTIGNLNTWNPDKDSPENAPLFYSYLPISETPLYTTLNDLSVSNVQKDYTLASISFDANFSYLPYAYTAKTTYKGSYKIKDFLKDATTITDTNYNLKAFHEDGSPIVIASPITYQGQYNDAIDYKTGEQVSLLLDKNPNKGEYVYSFIKDKPINLQLLTESGAPNSKFKEYLKILMVNETEKQTPYKTTEVPNFRGVYNNNTQYRAGDVVRSVSTNELFIFHVSSNELQGNSSIFQGTDLSTLLPSDLTNNHIQMIAMSKMLGGTIPENFLANNIVLSTVQRNNLGVDNSNAILLANVKLSKWYNNAGLLINNTEGFASIPITISFDIKTSPTSIIDDYPEQFSDMFSNIYPYEMTSEKIKSNTLFLNRLIQLNIQAGNFYKEMNIKFLTINYAFPNDQMGYIDIQLSINKWYNSEGILQNSGFEKSIRVGGFKKGVQTKLATNDIKLFDNQLNVPGLGGKMPKDVTVAEFSNDKNNIINFLIEYIDPLNNKLLLPENAKVAGFTFENVLISNVLMYSSEGYLTFDYAFKGYFASSNDSSADTIKYLSTVSPAINFKLAGFSKKIDNTIDNYDYFSVIDLSSNSINKPSEEIPGLSSSLVASLVPSRWIANRTLDEIKDPLIGALIQYYNAASINEVDNPQYIASGFALSDVGNFTEGSLKFNNFTGRVNFKVNLRIKTIINDAGQPVLVDNSIKYPGNLWKTSPECTETISLIGFNSVSPSKLNNTPLPFINTKNNSINMNLNIDNINSNLINVTNYEILNKIKFNGSWAIMNGKTLTILNEDLNTLENNPLGTPIIEIDKINNLVTINYILTSDLYYFAEQSDIPSTNPFLNPNLGKEILLSKGSKFTVNVTGIKSGNSLELIFIISVSIFALILLLTIVFILIQKSKHRKIYK